MTFAAYAAPDGWQRPVAGAVVVVLALVNCAGITRTALLTRVLVVARPASRCVVAVVACFRGGRRPGWPGGPRRSTALYGVLQSAGLLFFAFAGYARIATLGEEVREPERVIPRAIVLALAGAVVVYAVVAVAVLSVLGPDGTGRARAAPVADAVAPPASAWAGRRSSGSARRWPRRERCSPWSPDSGRTGAGHGPRGRPAALARRRPPAVPGARTAPS